VDLSRHFAASREVGPSLVGPVLAATAAAVVLSVFGPLHLAPLLLLCGVGLAVLVGLWRFDLWYSAFLTYLLFETVIAEFLPGQLGLLSKDLFYLGMVALGLFILAARGAREEERPLAGATGALLLFMLFQVLLLLRGPSAYLGALSFRGTAFMGLVAVLTPLAQADARARRTTLILLSCGLVAVALVSFWEVYAWRQVREVLQLSEQRWTMGTLKATSTVGSPGALGAVMAVGLIFAFARMIEGKMRGRIWVALTVASGLWFASLVLSLSRIAQLSLVVVTLVLLLRRPRLLLPGILTLFCAGAIADVATGGFFSGNILATFGIGSHLDAIASTQDRVSIINEVLTNYWPRHPWLGYGLGSVGAVTRSHLVSAPLGYLFLDNLYLKSLMEGGAIGAVLELLFVVVPLGAAVRLDRKLSGSDAQPWRRAMVRGAGATVLFHALLGTASTVQEMPVVNVTLWWAIGLLFAEAARQRAEAQPGVKGGRGGAATAIAAGLTVLLTLGGCGGGCNGGDARDAIPDTSATLCTEEANLTFRPSDKVGSKDFSLLYDGSRFHIFHIRENGAWMGRSVERRFGHEDSADLVHWTRHDPVELRGGEGSWNDRHLWSPFLLFRDGKWWMYYTGVSYGNDARLNLQRIGLAFSEDLEHWTSPSSTVQAVEGRGCVLEGVAAWSSWGEGEPWTGDCRDPFVARDHDRWVMFVALRMRGGDPVIAWASSDDGLVWSLGGPILATRGAKAESPAAVRRKGSWLLLWSSPNGIRAARAQRVEGPWEAAAELNPGFACELLPLGEDWAIYGFVDGQFRVRWRRLNLDTLQVSHVVSPLCPQVTLPQGPLPSP
jgi:hypothetical protein